MLGSMGPMKPWLFSPDWGGGGTAASAVTDSLVVPSLVLNGRGIFSGIESTILATVLPTSTRGFLSFSF